MQSKEIRAIFLDFFRKKGHTVVYSSSLVPGNDPTLLFTNAGMVQFKEVFLGQETRPYQRAASVQRCMRAGGKHNDLEKVGHTARHHTFFEMLGNFSFGDYFKREAIHYAWEFLTKTLALSPKKLWITVYEQDLDTEQVWLNELKIDPKRFARCGTQDNFWAMGETGPCGPCTEIYYDHGPAIAGGPPGSVEAEGDRFTEIWNLVFMQYKRMPDGQMLTLPKPSVDTGMGLERLAAVLQGVHNNYESDLFLPLIQEAADLAGTQDLSSVSLKVIADHIRASAFLIADGVTPSNEGRGYVLRRIVRRALRHGYQLKIALPFLYRLVEPLAKQMGSAYPELVQYQKRIVAQIRQEEEQFGRTLHQGMQWLSQELNQCTHKILPGSVLFKLHDTYGFPVDLVGDILSEKGIGLDMAGFEAKMETQRERARRASQFTTDYTEAKSMTMRSEFKGYACLDTDAKVIGLVQNGQLVSYLEAGAIGGIVLDQTSFYAESGGQIGDGGVILQGVETLFEVADTQKQNQAYIHQGQLVKGELKIGDSVEAKVSLKRRTATALNHSATHLLHAALRRILGPEVLQKGSWVGPERLRFDFAYTRPVPLQELQTIEHQVNAEIRANRVVETHLASPAEAIRMGALALFGEKYGETVRVLKMGDVSLELCGGTHVARTGDIGCFKIVSETGIAAGVRRIDAVTGEEAVDAWERETAVIRQLAETLKTTPTQVTEKITQLLEKTRLLEKSVTQFQAKEARAAALCLLTQVKEVHGIKVLAAMLDVPDVKLLREMVDLLKNKLASGIVLLASTQNNKVTLIAGVTQDYQNKFKAGDLVHFVAVQLGGKGGGRADLAEGGGIQVDALPQALGSVLEWVERKN